jgi:hypothetical protein
MPELLQRFPACPATPAAGAGLALSIPSSGHGDLTVQEQSHKTCAESVPASGVSR